MMITAKAGENAAIAGNEMQMSNKRFQDSFINN
jgi:hypothetical protein